MYLFDFGKIYGVRDEINNFFKQANPTDAGDVSGGSHDLETVIIF